MLNKIIKDEVDYHSLLEIENDFEYCWIFIYGIKYYKENTNE